MTKSTSTISYSDREECWIISRNRLVLGHFETHADAAGFVEYVKDRYACGGCGSFQHDANHCPNYAGCVRKGHDHQGSAA